MVFSMMRRAPFARPQVPAPMNSTAPSPPRRISARRAERSSLHVASVWQRGPLVTQAIRSGQGCPGEWVHSAQQG